MTGEKVQTAPPADCFDFVNAALRVLRVGGYLHTLDDPIRPDWQTIDFVPRHPDSDMTDAFEATAATLRTRIPFSSARPQGGESYLWMRVYEERPLLAPESFSSWQMPWVLITPFTGFFNRNHQEFNFTWLSETALNAAPPILLHGGVRMAGNYSIRTFGPADCHGTRESIQDVTVVGQFNPRIPSQFFDWLVAIADSAELRGIEDLMDRYRIFFDPESELGRKVIIR